MNNSETDKKEKIEVLGPKEKADALRALCEGSFKGVTNSKHWNGR